MSGKGGLQAEVLCQVLQVLFNRLSRQLSNRPEQICEKEDLHTQVIPAHQAAEEACRQRCPCRFSLRCARSATQAAKQEACRPVIYKQVLTTPDNQHTRRAGRLHREPSRHSAGQCTSYDAFRGDQEHQRRVCERLTRSAAGSSSSLGGAYCNSLRRLHACKLCNSGCGSQQAAGW